MKARVVLWLVFSLASALAETRPAEKSDEADDAQASAAFLSGDYDAAIVLYTEVIKADPKAALAHNGRALAYRYKKDTAKALADFDQAIRLKPLSMFYFNRGVTCYEIGDDKAAIADLTRALQAKSSDPQMRASCLVMRARCYISQEKSAPALSDLNAAIKLHADSETYRLRGIIRKVAHEYDKSLADYEKAMALDPKSADAYTTAAYLLAVCPAPKYRDGTKAVRYATTACELTEWQDAGAIEALAAAYAETDDFDKAIEFQKKANEMVKKEDSDRLRLYEKHEPFRDLNRDGKMFPSAPAGGVSIKTGQKLSAGFETDGEQLINPKVVTAGALKKESFLLDFHLEKGRRVLRLEHSFSKTIRVRCVARLQGQDAYFETDLLPVPPRTINPEIWSETIEELVLFDFHFASDDSQQSVTSRARLERRLKIKGPGFSSVLLRDAKDGWSE